MQEYLTENPDAGEIIIGTGGIRKFRWRISGKGKSGGVRTIYIDFASYEKIYLLGAYSKSIKETLTEIEKKELRAISKNIIM